MNACRVRSGYMTSLPVATAYGLSIRVSGCHGGHSWRRHFACGRSLQGA